MNTDPSLYIIREARRPPDLAVWEDEGWKDAETLTLTHVFSQSSEHVPDTRVRLLYSARGLYGIFRVNDQFVRAVHCGNQAPVYRDSCVEFFVQPVAGAGYLNVEMNCGGSLLCTWVRDPRRVETGLADCVPLDVEELALIRRVASLPKRVDPEIREKTTWTLGFFLPMALFQTVVPEMKEGSWKGQEWLGNFYKCADETSHPHWISWRPIPELNFHRPDCFGSLRFE